MLFKRKQSASSYWVFVLALTVSLSGCTGGVDSSGGQWSVSADSSGADAGSEEQDTFSRDSHDGDEPELDVRTDGADADHFDSGDACSTARRLDAGDLDHDGIPDDCDRDLDRDSFFNERDNCPRVYNPSQVDSDGDGTGDRCDDDVDGDDVPDVDDNCPSIANPVQDAAASANDPCDVEYLATEADVIYGEGDAAAVGVASAEFAGDINGDGMNDILVERLDGSGNFAGVELYFGGAGVADQLRRAAADVDIVRPSVSDAELITSAGVGDINGDGFDDLMVGDQSDDSGLEDGGAAFLIFGAGAMPTRLEFAQADAVFTGEQSGHHAGTLARAGDVNADGYDDFLVGAPDFTPSTSGGARFPSSVYLFFGGDTFRESQSVSSADVVFRSREKAYYRIESFAGVGDIDGDGVDDVAITVPGSSPEDDHERPGYVHLFRGANLQTGYVDVTESDTRLDGEEPGDRAGTSIAGGFDFNGDGYDDLVVGAPKSDEAGVNAGRAYLVLGRSRFNSYRDLKYEVVFEGSGESLELGGSVRIVDDLNLDGFADVMIGASGGADSGIVYVHYGAPGGTPFVAPSEAPLSFFGFGDFGTFFDGGADVTSDGYPDFLMLGESANHAHKMLFFEGMLQ